MVQSILDNRKKMTRRVMKPQPTNDDINFIEDWSDVPMCKYLIGDVLWVRETFKPNNIPTGWPFHYRAANDTFTDPENEKWKPNIFMPKAACRIFLEITNIRVERLNDISEQDAIAEGIERTDFNSFFNEYYKNYLPTGYTDLLPKDSFKSLWQSINGKDSWEANQWVWVISFKRIEKPENFNNEK